MQNSITQSSSSILHVACPNCGSTQVHKSIIGKVEHGTLLGGKEYVKMRYGEEVAEYGSMVTKFVSKRDADDLIKDEVPYQQVCDYCHNTFHARQSKIDAGAYSMDIEKAEQLTAAYNAKLQKVKEKDLENTRAQASKKLVKAFIGVAIFVIGLYIYNNCEHMKEGIFGMSEYTWSFMFSCLMMFIGAVYAIISGFSSFCAYDDASQIEKMTISQYAKDHRA